MILPRWNDARQFDDPLTCSQKKKHLRAGSNNPGKGKARDMVELDIPPGRGQDGAMRIVDLCGLAGSRRPPEGRGLRRLLGPRIRRTSRPRLPPEDPGPRGGGPCPVRPEARRRWASASPTRSSRPSPPEFGFRDVEMAGIVSRNAPTSALADQGYVVYVDTAPGDWAVRVEGRSLMVDIAARTGGVMVYFGGGATAREELLEAAERGVAAVLVEDPGAPAGPSQGHLHSRQLWTTQGSPSFRQPRLDGNTDLAARSGLPDDPGIKC